MMQLDHERLDVYDLALEFLVLANGIVEGLPRGRSHNGAVRVAARPAGRGARGPGPAPQTSAYQQKRAQRLHTDRRARARARLRARASDPNSGTRPSAVPSKVITASDATNRAINGAASSTSQPRSGRGGATGALGEARAQEWQSEGLLALGHSARAGGGDEDSQTWIP